jgi:Polysaccharide pyruvyl transferase
VRALVAGWFSFETMGATAGDLLARDVACRWLAEAGVPFDVACAPPFSGDVDWRDADPRRYSHVVFVCGPFGNGWPLSELLERFRDSSLVAVNVSLLEPLARWNPFSAVFPRDGADGARPDVCFLSHPPDAPVVGVVLVHPQTEYDDGAHDVAGAAIAQLVERADVTAVPLDTRLDANASGLVTEAQVESLIARMDAVVTTRLHGLVLALKNGVPALAIDPIRGGAKVKRQAETVAWPVCFTPEALDARELDRALAWCLTPDARAAARECAARAASLLADLPAQFKAAVAAQ